MPCSDAVLMLNQKVDWTKAVTLEKLTFYPWAMVLAVHQPSTQNSKVEDCKFKVRLRYIVRLSKTEYKTKQRDKSSSSLASKLLSIFLSLCFDFVSVTK